MQQQQQSSAATAATNPAAAPAAQPHKRRKAAESAPLLRAVISPDLRSLELRHVNPAEEEQQPDAELPAPELSLWACLENTLTGSAAQGVEAARGALLRWSASDAQLRMCLGPSYLFEWASQDYTRVAQAAAVEHPAATSAQRERRRELMLRYIAASRGRLLQGGQGQAPLGGEVAAAIELLRGHAEAQHAKNVASLDCVAERVRRGEEDQPRPVPDAAVDTLWVEQLTKQCCRLLDVPEKPDACHHCQTPVSSDVDKGHHLGQAASCVRCRISYCRSCLRKTYDQTLAQMSAPEWTCPRCLGGCWCMECTRLARIVVLKRAFGVPASTPALEACERSWFK